MKLLAIIIAFGLFNYVAKPQFLISFQWLKQLQTWVNQSVSSVQIQWLIQVLIPLTLLWFIVDVLVDVRINSVSYLLIHVAVLYYCLGPRTIAADLEDQTLRDKLNIPVEAAPNQIVTALTDAALHRWFGVFFWYVVLGIYGALGYRIICYIARHSDAIVEFAVKMLKLIEFPVIILMTVSLALASDFDKIWKHCKQYLTRETMLALNSLFLYKSMDFAVEQCEIETQDEQKEQIVERTTFTVLKRMLVVWLVFVALLVLFSKG